MANHFRTYVLGAALTAVLFVFQSTSISTDATTITGTYGNTYAITAIVADSTLLYVDSAVAAPVAIDARLSPYLALHHAARAELALDKTRNAIVKTAARRAWGAGIDCSHVT